MTSSLNHSDCDNINLLFLFGFFTLPLTSSVITEERESVFVFAPVASLFSGGVTFVRRRQTC